LIECRQLARASLLVDDRAGWAPMPFSSLEKVHEVDVEGMIRLTYLPILDAAGPLKFLTESPNLIRQRLGRGRARQKPSDPSYAVRGGRRPHHLGLEQELAELLE
jgi:hypothetical protein